MSSSNKLNLKEFVQADQSSKIQENPFVPTQRIQQKPLKNERKSGYRQSKKLKLNTLPCEEIQKDGNEKFLFRSTWQDDTEHFKEEMKGCTSPTFATQILSHAHNHSSIFPLTDQINQQAEQSSKRTRASNSRSKSKHNKSLQKFIGDNVSTHRPSNSTIEKSSSQIKLENHAVSNAEEMYLYEMNKMESVNHELKRENKKLQEKCNQLKEKCQQLEDCNKQNTTSNSDNLMTNQTLLLKMKNQSFWKFYLKAQKIIKASITENNQQTFPSPINFMKELEALREMTSEMKKENKQLRKQKDEKNDQLEKLKDRLSVQEAEVEEMRLKCVAYESSIKRLRGQLQKNQKDLEKLSELKELQQRLSAKTQQSTTLSKQFSSLSQQLQEQKLLNSECQKQRLSTKKKNLNLQEEITSLNKQLSSIKTSYNLLEIQKQELSANKKELIEKERLKEKIFQLQKEIKSVQMAKEEEINKIKQIYQMRYGKEIEMKDSQVKQLDEKVGVIMSNITELQKQNSSYAETNKKLTEEITQLTQHNEELQNQLTSTHRQLASTCQQKQSKLSELSKQLQTLSSKLEEQSTSLLTQQSLIQQLKKQINQKEELLKVKDFESQKLKASLEEINEERERENHQIQDSGKDDNGEWIKEKAELEEYVATLQEKHNEALEMYETVHNQKVQLQLQLQYCEQQIEKLTSQLWQNSSHSSKSQSLPNSQTLDLIESLLTIKEEIIKKILVFCPQDYRELLVEYIYYGDMIKEKYIEIINCQGEFNQGMNDCHNEPDNQSSQEQSYLQVEEDNSNFYPSHQTRRNHYYHENSHYNKTKPYQSRNPHYETSSEPAGSEPQDIHSKEEQINHLLEQFIKIGNIIDEETRQNYHKEKPRRKQGGQASREKEEELRRSKEKEMRLSKNLLSQFNKKIQTVKENNMNTENSFHYKLAGCQGDRRQPSISHKNFSEDQPLSTEPVQRPIRQPLQQSDQSNISRPLFTAKDIKIRNPNMRNAYNQQIIQQKSYEAQGSVQRSTMTPVQQTPYQKGPHRQAPQGKNNFNHGALNKLNMLNISDRIRQ